LETIMKTTVLFVPAVAGALLAASAAAFAAEDPIAVRKALMDSMGGAAGLYGGVMKGEVDYSPAIGMAAITTAAAVAAAVPDFFPAGSDTGDTTASPKIWEDPDGFAAKIGELQQATAKAVAAAGEDGPADAEAFKAAMEPVTGLCKECHETYRVKK
jgi:cytochrome c556